MFLPPSRRRATCPSRFRPAVEALEGRLLLSTYPVTTTAGRGPGSLRHAILDANANPGPDTITFNIGGGGVQTNAPTRSLPVITDAVDIDGTTQPGYVGKPLIVLTGSSAGPNASGIRIAAGNSTVKGLVINGFGGDGIVLTRRGGNAIVGNYIGTDVTGTL